MHSLIALIVQTDGLGMEVNSRYLEQLEIVPSSCTEEGTDDSSGRLFAHHLTLFGYAVSACLNKTVADDVSVVQSGFPSHLTPPPLVYQILEAIDLLPGK